MIVTVLFFAQARDRAGAGSASLELASGALVRDALDALARRHPALAELWPHLAIAVDGVLVRPEAPLADGNELALLPPVSGG